MRLPGVAAAAVSSKITEIEPVQDEQTDQEKAAAESRAAAESPAGAEHRGANHQKDEPDCRIDQERRGSHRETGGAYRDRDTLGGFRRENGVDRWVQARMTMVSAM